MLEPAEPPLQQEIHIIYHVNSDYLISQELHLWHVNGELPAEEKLGSWLHPDSNTDMQ